VTDGPLVGVTAGQVLCPIVVGRDAELALIDRALAEARRGRGGVVLLVGEPGIGKSRLTREAEQRARATAMRVLRGRATSTAIPSPYRPVIEALHPVLDDLERLDDPELAPHLGVVRQFLGRTDNPDGHGFHQLLLFEAVGHLVAAVGRRDGALVVLEDLHWADSDTLALLDHLADDAPDRRALVLGTLRDDPGPALDLAEAMAARRAGTALRLVRLPPDGVERMVGAALHIDDVPRDLLDSLHDRAEGVPFVVEEMLTTYVASGRDARAPAALPHTFRELARRRLAVLDDIARGVLFAAAVIGRTFDWSLLSDVTGLPREQVLAALHEAVRSQLVVADLGGGFEMPFGFRHALVREAVLAELLPPELAQLSKTAADAIEARFPGLPDEWCGRVAQLREAAGNRTAAARDLQEAARRAIGRGALGSAIDMLEHARTLTATDRWHTIGIDRQLIDALSLAGRIDRLREIGDMASRFIEEKRRIAPFATLARGEVHLRIARAVAAAGDEAGADEHLDQARDYLQQTGEQPIWAALRAFEAERALARGDVIEARAAAEEALAITEREPSHLDEVVGDALSVAGRASLAAGDADGALELFGRAHDSARRPLQRLRALLDVGTARALLDGSTDALEEVRAVAAEYGALDYGVRADLAVAATLVDRFDLGAAGEHTQRCIDQSRRYHLSVLPDALVLEARRLALTADLAGARVLLHEAGLRDAPDAALTAAVISLLDEDLDGAREALRTVRFGVGAGLTALLAARAGTAAPLVPVAGPVAEGLRRHAAAIGAKDAGRFHQADGVLAAFPWWRHIARRVAAESAIEARWGEPALWLRESLAFFEGAGHDRTVQACRSLLRRSGAPVPRKGRGDSRVPEALRRLGVTSREMDVLRLIAEGLGNRQIGERLFLSPRTVETHVASLMRRLDVSTRADLGAMIVTDTTAATNRTGR
jgi:DNA-binding CsgD family transcriptional regulator/tetratricopeptide (TPR) repeat protein